MYKYSKINKYKNYMGGFPELQETNGHYLTKFWNQ